MKTLHKILLTLTLLAGSAYASSNILLSHQVKEWYQMDLKSSEKLKEGSNTIKIKITHKEHTVVGADVKLEIKNKSEMIDYKSIKTDDLGNYIFSINLPTKGVYNYKISFNRVGEKVRVFTGKLENK